MIFSQYDKDFLKRYESILSLSISLRETLEAMQVGDAIAFPPHYVKRSSLRTQAATIAHKRFSVIGSRQGTVILIRRE